MANSPENGNGNGDWDEYRRLILSNFSNLNSRVDRLEVKLDLMRDRNEERLAALHTDLVMLKTKATIWGGLAGVVLGGAASFIVSLLGR